MICQLALSHIYDGPSRCGVVGPYYTPHVQPTRAVISLTAERQVYIVDTHMYYNLSKTKLDAGPLLGAGPYGGAGYHEHIVNGIICLPRCEEYPEARKRTDCWGTCESGPQLVF